MNNNFNFNNSYDKLIKGLNIKKKKPSKNNDCLKVSSIFITFTILGIYYYN